jgi:hypothetical protein
MTGLDLEEYEKCLKNPIYFFEKYFIVTTKREVKRETVEGKRFEEVANIFLKYFCDEKHREHYSTTIKLIEIVTHSDGEKVFVLSFKDIWYDVNPMSFEYYNALGLIRKEKILKLLK